MKQTDPVAFDGDRCRHIHADKLLDSELRQCPDCGQLFGPLEEVEPIEPVIEAI